MLDYKLAGSWLLLVSFCTQVKQPAYYNVVSHSRPNVWAASVDACDLPDDTWTLL